MSTLSSVPASHKHRLLRDLNLQSVHWDGIFNALADTLQLQLQKYVTDASEAVKQLNKELVSHKTQQVLPLTLCRATSIRRLREVVFEPATEDSPEYNQTYRALGIHHGIRARTSSDSYVERGRAVSVIVPDLASSPSGGATGTDREGEMDIPDVPGSRDVGVSCAGRQGRRGLSTGREPAKIRVGPRSCSADRSAEKRSGGAEEPGESLVRTEEKAESDTRARYLKLLKRGVGMGGRGRKDKDRDDPYVALARGRGMATVRPSSATTGNCGTVLCDASAHLF